MADRNDENKILSGLSTILILAASGLLGWMAWNVADSKERVRVLESEMRRVQQDVIELNRRTVARPPF